MPSSCIATIAHSRTTGKRFCLHTALTGAHADRMSVDVDAMDQIDLHLSGCELRVGTEVFPNRGEHRGIGEGVRVADERHAMWAPIWRV